MRIKVEKVEKKTGKNGKDYYVVHWENAKASSFQKDFEKAEGKEVEVEVTEKDGYKNVKFIGFVEGQAAPVSQMPQQTPEVINMKLRAKSIEYALKSAELSKAPLEESKSNIVITVAERYFRYITNTTE